MPNPYADDVWMATQQFTFRSSTALSWTKLVDVDASSEEFLREHYGARTH